MIRRTLALAVSFVLPVVGFVACSQSGADPWADHRGDVPFAVGDLETGRAASRETGRPPAYFFTATW